MSQARGPWDDHAIGRFAFITAEELVKCYAPELIPESEIIGAFIRLHRRPPRDEELEDIVDHLFNYGLFKPADL